MVIDLNGLTDTFKMIWFVRKNMPYIKALDLCIRSDPITTPLVTWRGLLALTVTCKWVSWSEWINFLHYRLVGICPISSWHPSDIMVGSVTFRVWYVHPYILRWKPTLFSIIKNLVIAQKNRMWNVEWFKQFVSGISRADESTSTTEVTSEGKTQEKMPH